MYLILESGVLERKGRRAYIKGKLPHAIKAWGPS
jgi:hypothetical protein